jgi:hypothetical protein
MSVYAVFEVDVRNPGSDAYAAYRAAVPQPRIRSDPRCGCLATALRI